MFLYIKAYRLRAKISVPKMSEMTGIPVRTIEALEKRGDCLVSNAYKIAAALGVTLNDLLAPPCEVAEQQETEQS